MIVEQKRMLRPMLSIYGYRYRIYIGKDVIRALQCPEHICLKINESINSIAVMPSDSSEIMSFRVPEKYFHSRSSLMQISSKQFVCMLLEKNKLAVTGTYMINGTYSEMENACVFRLNDIVEDRALKT